MPTILFECKSTPSYGHRGMHGGSSVTIYSNGDVVHRQFIVGYPELTEEIMLLQKPELASDIGVLLLKFTDELAKLPPKLNNGSLDGSHDCFRFGRTHISAWSITRMDPQDIVTDDSEGSLRLRENAEFENFILDVYAEIISVLRAYGVKESLPLAFATSKGQFLRDLKCPVHHLALTN